MSPGEQGGSSESAQHPPPSEDEEGGLRKLWPFPVSGETLELPWQARMISPAVEKLAQNWSQAGPAHTPESQACTPVPRPLTQRLGGCSVPPDSGSGPREDRPVPHPCPGLGAPGLQTSLISVITATPMPSPLQQISPLRLARGFSGSKKL